MDSTITFMEDAHSKKSTLVDAVASLFKSKRLLIIQVISMFTFFASALAAWKMLSYTPGYGHSRCRDPYVVCSVLPSRPSGSMLPEYRRGDVLLIDNRFHAIQIADIVVYNIPGRNIPIVHRVHVIHNPYLL